MSLALIAVCLMGLLVVGLVSTFNPFGETRVDRSGPTMLEQIRELQEFTAAEGTFSQDVDLERDAKYLPGFLKGERVIALVVGTVRASVDFGALDADSVQVDEDRTSITITLPEPVLSDADIDESTTRIIGRDRGLFDRVSDFFADNPIDDSDLYKAAETKVEAASRESDLIEEARDNTEKWLTAFLNAAGFDEVEILWTDSPT